MKPTAIIFSNQKGGTGKTTTCRELSIYTASREYNVLIIDCDPQGNLTKSLTEAREGLYEAFDTGSINFTEIDNNTTLLSGDVRLQVLEKSLISEIDCYTRLKELIATDKFQRFDFIFIDTPPSLGLLTINALTAADYIVIPIRPSLYSLQGTNDLMSAVSKVKKTFNPNLTLLGVIINSYESIPVITQQLKDEIFASFGNKVFSSVLSKTIKIEEAIAEKCGVIYLKKLDRSRARDEIEKIGAELLTRIKEQGVVRWRETG